MLSRAFGIHHRLARQILIDFHCTENSKAARSVHATYIITGVQKAAESNAGQENQGEDEPMQSSPFLSSSQRSQNTAASAVERLAIILAREEDLDGKIVPLVIE